MPTLVNETAHKLNLELLQCFTIPVQVPGQVPRVKLPFTPWFVPHIKVYRDQHDGTKFEGLIFLLQDTI